ncbi:poly-beta-hydroxybutyrate polymerase [Piscirickettsiaceae bacterium NZ-RLO2]|uniref:PHA/PHB synthase family protein n=1 Tax=Piscirickettsia salmonis TaxID=1238 RepID=UPI000F07F957|nr:poly-beta-hydroxybutyrate polymerase [Piscirickettsiaceae bacterium NZ-RLO2]
MNSISLELKEKFDDQYQQFLSLCTYGASPEALSLALYDWFIHFITAPGTQLWLAADAWEKVKHLMERVTDVQNSQDELKTFEFESDRDHRFRESEWQQFPFNMFAQNFLNVEHWLQQAILETRGANKHHIDLSCFAVRQLCDMWAPSNFLPTNPVALKTTWEERGLNLAKGHINWLETIMPRLKSKETKYKVGKTVAITEGKVVFRNDLIELIQYLPKTKTVYKEPILIFPSWIMKYYILDLSPHNSLVKYFVEKGHQVFIISWKNPEKDNKDTSLNDYIFEGGLEAVDVVSTITKNTQIHLAGYCLGGTLAAIVAAWLGKIKSKQLKTLTLFAAQTDFEQPGELQLFIDESQVASLEAKMATQGYLSGQQMASAFQLLHSNDLIWSRMQHAYFLGKEQTENDLMAWNNDATRLPLQMHKDYLTKLYLKNEFAEGHFKITNKVVSLKDIRVPLFMVGTQKDHVSPWESVYKAHLLADTNIDFILTSGGHNAGIVSEPGHPRRYFFSKKTPENQTYLSPENWLKKATRHEGSWWPHWHKWLVDHSSQKQTESVDSLGHAKYPPLMCAPGKYVLVS